MAKTVTAPFAQTPKVLTAIATTAVPLTGANSFLTDTPSNTVNLTNGVDTGASAEGALVTSLAAIPRSTVTATALFVWGSVDSGTTKRLLATGLMSARGVSATALLPWEALTHPDGTTISETSPLRLQANEEVYVGMGVTWADGVSFAMRMTDFA